MDEADGKKISAYLANIAIKKARVLFKILASEEGDEKLINNYFLMFFTISSSSLNSRQYKLVA